MDSARLENSGVPYSMRHGPTRSMMARSTGSDFLRWLTALRMAYTCTTKLPPRANEKRIWSWDFLPYSVILNAAVFQAKRRIEVLSGFEREPNETTTPILASARSLHRDSHDFKVSSPQQLVRSYECPGRIIAVKISLVHAVESSVEIQIGTEDLDRNNVVHGQARGLDGLLDALHHQAQLVLRVRRSLPRFRVEAKMSGDVKCVTRQNAFAERQSFRVRGPRVHDVLTIGCRCRNAYQQAQHAQ